MLLQHLTGYQTLEDPGKDYEVSSVCPLLEE